MLKTDYEPKEIKPFSFDWMGVFRLVTTILLGLLAYLWTAEHTTVEEGRKALVNQGLTISEMSTEQRLMALDIKDLKDHGYVTRAEHTALEMRVTAMESGQARIETKLDILLQDRGLKNK